MTSEQLDLLLVELNVPYGLVMHVRNEQVDFLGLWRSMPRGDWLAWLCGVAADVNDDLRRALVRGLCECMRELVESINQRTRVARAFMAIDHWSKSDEPWERWKMPVLPPFPVEDDNRLYKVAQTIRSLWRLSRPRSDADNEPGNSPRSSRAHSIIWETEAEYIAAVPRVDRHHRGIEVQRRTIDTLSTHLSPGAVLIGLVGRLAEIYREKEAKVAELQGEIEWMKELVDPPKVTPA